MFHALNYNAFFLIYVMECTKYSKQYIAQSQTEFNKRLNSHRKDIKSPNAIPACKYFNQDHDIDNGTMFTLPETLDFEIASSYLTIQRLK